MLNLLLSQIHPQRQLYLSVLVAAWRTFLERPHDDNTFKLAISYISDKSPVSQSVIKGPHSHWVGKNLARLHMLFWLVNIMVTCKQQYMVRGFGAVPSCSKQMTTYWKSSLNECLEAHVINFSCQRWWGIAPVTLLVHGWLIIGVIFWFIKSIKFKQEKQMWDSYLDDTHVSETILLSIMILTCNWRFNTCAVVLK